MDAKGAAVRARRMPREEASMFAGHSRRAPNQVRDYGVWFSTPGQVPGGRQREQAPALHMDLDSRRSPGMGNITPSKFAGHDVSCPCDFLVRWGEWAQSEDTRKIFTPGGGLAQVPVGVKKNRLR